MFLVVAMLNGITHVPLKAYPVRSEKCELYHHQPNSWNQVGQRIEKRGRMLTDSLCTGALDTALHTSAKTLCTAWLVQELSVVILLTGITRSVLMETDAQTLTHQKKSLEDCWKSVEKRNQKMLHAC